LRLAIVSLPSPHPISMMRTRAVRENPDRPFLCVAREEENDHEPHELHERG
jgi:hypothetical protein